MSTSLRWFPHSKVGNRKLEIPRLKIKKVTGEHVASWISTFQNGKLEWGKAEFRNRKGDKWTVRIPEFLDSEVGSRKWKVEGRKVEVGKVSSVWKRLFFLQIGYVSFRTTVIVIFKLENDCKRLSIFDGLTTLGWVPYLKQVQAWEIDSGVY